MSSSTFDAEHDTTQAHGWRNLSDSLAVFTSVKTIDEEHAELEVATIPTATDVTSSVDETSSVETPVGSDESRADHDSQANLNHEDDFAPLKRGNLSMVRPPPRAHPALSGDVSPPQTSLTASAKAALGNGRVSNFGPGPTSLPRPVESKIAAMFADPSRLTSLALSHRTPEFKRVLDDARDNLRRVMNVPMEYEILFLHGGGHGQFAAVPLNLCPGGQDDVGTYVVSGTWSERSLVDGRKYCSPNVIDAKDLATGKYVTFPNLSEENEATAKIDPQSKFVYLCSNETVNGVEVFDLPVLPPHLRHIPLIVDASSDFTSKPVDFVKSNVGVLFACASKNVGHPGVTVAIVRRDLLGDASPYCPSVLDYTLNADSGNLYNTTPTFNVEVVGCVMEWILEQGGVEETERRSKVKAELIHSVVESSQGFYVTAPVDEQFRSRMNVPFKIAGRNAGTSLPTKEDVKLTEEFLIRCWEEGMVGLRTPTPFGFGDYLRASLYHGVDVEDAERLADFMKKYADEQRGMTIATVAAEE
uniref:phosphoserine transaminase n=1 Tax=Odontella aurita TaxID=265563 RepID=A0A7S4MM96_9STRA|mmetsp:Transcript_25710/g.75841  ORF Transcript_25710/g.75841 Transcript_25710/m.75841 type:complete len:530 (+) Transcript_25710:425-2014(+)